LTAHDLLTGLLPGFAAFRGVELEKLVLRARDRRRERGD